jgi:hypothetical protein
VAGGSKLYNVLMLRHMIDLTRWRRLGKKGGTAA